jgi:outer membrane protein OmpA-like peptidoglycan-associated protein
VWALAPEEEEVSRLQELQRLLVAPPAQPDTVTPEKKRVRMRAIVFEAEPAASATPNPTPSTAVPASAVAAPAVAKAAAAPPAAAVVSVPLLPVRSGSMDACGQAVVQQSARTVDFTIQFKVGSAEILPHSESRLREIGQLLQLAPDRCVVIEGHTDATGNPERNIVLSQDRANAVVQFLAGKAGVNPKRLLPVGKGSTEPIKSLDAKDPKNRRVAFKVIG